MPGIRVRCFSLRSSDIFSSSMWNESLDCPGGERGDLKGSLGRGVTPRPSNPDSVYDENCSFRSFRCPSELRQETLFYETFYIK